MARFRDVGESKFGLNSVHPDALSFLPTTEISCLRHSPSKGIHTAHHRPWLCLQASVAERRALRSRLLMRREPQWPGLRDFMCSRRVRRPGVTEALNALRKQKLISYKRGQITVLNRKGLERTAGEAYGIPEAEYRRLIG